MSHLTRLAKQVHFWRIAALLAADGLVFGMTDPQSTPSFMLAVGIILLSVTMYYLLDGLLALTKLYGLPVRHRRRVLRSATLLVSGLVALQSVGQLSFRDVIVLAPLTCLLYFYVAYSKSARQRPEAVRDLA